MATQRAYGLTQTDLRRLQKMLRWWEGQPAYAAGLLDSSGRQVRDRVGQWVQITSTTQTGGRYPGKWYSYDQTQTPTGGWTQEALDIWVVDRSFATLAVGARYWGWYHGPANGRDVFVIEHQAGGGAATVFSGCRIYHNTRQFFAPGGFGATTVVFNSEWFDTDNYHSTVTNPGLVTLPFDGQYWVSIWLRWDAAVLTSDGVNRQVQIMHQGIDVAGDRRQPHNGNETWQSCSCVIQGSAGDGLSVRVAQDSGNDLALVGGFGNHMVPAFQVVKLPGK